MSKPLYLPFANGQWRMVPGLMALDLQTWIEIDEHLQSELALKEQLLHQRYSEVFTGLPGSEPGQQESLQLILAHLLEYFPQYYRRQGSQIENLATGQIWQPADFETAPLDLAGRLIQEDLCLMQPKSSGYVLAAASVCFPSRWLLGEKIGRPMAQIHQPVPGYSDKLERPVNRFFDQLKADRPVWRLNWSVVDSPELFLMPAMEPERVTTINATNAGEKLWIRVERQTLRRLIHSGEILFTIRTYVHPLNILAANPVAASGLAAAINQVTPEMQRYKALLPIRTALLDYLATFKDVTCNVSTYDSWRL